MDKDHTWLFIVPATGYHRFDPELLVALVGPLAPPHIWTQDGFVMKSEDYQLWMEKGGGPIEAVSPRKVRISPLGCSEEIDRLMERLEPELFRIRKE